MTVSHSSFRRALSGSSGGRSSAARPSVSVSVGNRLEYCDGLTQQMELLRLLLCTMSLDTGHVKVEKETLASILSVYTASTNPVDRLLRRLMFLYEQSGSYKYEILMNDLRWGQMATNNEMQNGHETNNVGEESWDWFLGALDPDRVRLTLTQFPVTDTLAPLPNSIECAKDLNNEMKVEQFGSSADSEDEIDDDGSMSETGSGVTPHASARALSSSPDVDLWRGAGDDLRYSPGFILPLILATIEVYQPHDTHDIMGSSNHCENVDEGTKNQKEIAQCQAFAEVCRRVCDRGGIALAVASLSSRCPSVRKIAVAICGLFLKGLQMQESHGIKSWRERPQLEMIMSSIQRGLAVRRAIQMQRYDAQEGIEPGGSTLTTRKFNIPMLPAVSAMFLAKAVLILSQPRDNMYGQMNRYFLRLTDYHGAFQDCFGIPAFLSLYCSSSEELSRCRTERHWALLSLKDGAVDEFCYRIISQHHVPELIMSSFDCLVDNPESKSELFLTIDVIETLLKSGGARASTHLIKRQGLLSWLHGIVSWRKVSSVFPYMSLRCRFLKLITTAVDSYRCMKHSSVDDDVGALAFYEKVPLANAIIKICLEDGADTAENRDSSYECPPTLIESTCNALRAVHLADNESQAATTLVGSTSLRDATILLEKSVCRVDIFGKVLASMCDLPLVTNDADLPSARLFCGMALGFILEIRTQVPPDTVLLSLKRVNELMKRYPCLGHEARISSQVMRCRNFAVMVGGIEVWDESLSCLEEDKLN